MAFYSSEVGFVGSLFLASLNLFRDQVSCLPKENQASNWTKSGFKEELESFVLWGYHFDPSEGKLDTTVNRSPKELRESITANLGAIAYILSSRA